MRGQAFIVFKDISAAANALKSMQNFPLYDKPMRIQFAKSKSDVIAKMDGSYFEEKIKRDKLKTKEENQKKKEEKKKKTEKSKQEENPSAQPSTNLQPKLLPPNSILFVENLPDGCTEMMIQMLFQQFQGFVEVRMIEGKPGIAFVEYETEVQAGLEMNGLQNFKVTPKNLMLISYEKKKKQ